MVTRVEHKVACELDSLCIDNFQVVTVDHWLHEMLMNQPAKGSPLVSVVHHKQVVALRNKIVRDERWWPMAVDATLLINDLLDKSTIGNDSHVAISYLQHVEAAVLLRPFRESMGRIRILRG